MGISIKVLKCDATCQSCYENNIRKNIRREYDIKAIINSLVKQMKSDYYRDNPTLHGGEPLLLKLNDITKLLKIVFDKYKSTGIQTNLLKLKQKHIELFKKYKTNVGVSLDGNTKDMNKGRGYDPISVLNNMNLLNKNNIKMSVIIILRKYNSLNIDELLKFINVLKNDFGIVDIRTNPGIVFEEQHKMDEELTPKELGIVLCKIADLSFSDVDLKIQPIRDVVDLLFGFNNSSCSFSMCDPYHTTAELPIFENGMLGNCLKSGGAVDGIVALRNDSKSFERYDMLKQLPQSYNGCMDCEFWYMCYGGCPGAGIDNDWRNKTRFCESYKILFHYLTKKIKGLIPNIYLNQDFYPSNSNKEIVLNSISGSTWKSESKKNISELMKKCSKTEHNSSNTNHGDSHGDRPHGDSNDPDWVRKHGFNK